MSLIWLFFGVIAGIIIGMQYIPHQIKKKNPKVIQQVKELLGETRD